VMPVGFVSPVSMVEVDAKAMFEADWEAKHSRDRLNCLKFSIVSLWLSLWVLAVSASSSFFNASIFGMNYNLFIIETLRAFKWRKRW
jgi:hypothetical protein